MERDGKGSLDDTVATDEGGAPTLAGPPSGPGDRADPALARYQLSAVLGQGGMGEVSSARDGQIGRSVAIKRMRGAAPSAEATARFLREARIQGRLEHPAIVPVHELGHDDRGQPFFVMKQLTGVTLGAVLARLAAGDPETTKQFTRQRLLRAFTEVCLAIEFAHTRGVVHRDLKPANIMLGDFGEVYVLDWGIAHVAKELPDDTGFADVTTLEGGETMAGAILGTPGYMSPEQVRGDTNLDHRSDVYALGCILFEILAGKPLHTGGAAGLTSVLAGVDARPSRIAPDRDLPPELDAICVAATRLDRADRYATARELGDAVQRFLDGDRDVALRRDIALRERATAREAIAKGNTADDRRAAIRAAARALALVPTDRESADLVGWLMLEPPAEVPADVEVALVAIDEDSVRATGRLLILGALVYLAFLPILYWVGFRDPQFLAVAGGTVAGIGLAGWLAVRRWLRAATYISLASNSAMVALLAWAFTPFFIAPSLGVVVVMAIATHPRHLRAAVLLPVVAAAVLCPLVLEVLGLARHATIIAGDAIVLRTTATSLDPTATMVALVFYVVALLVVSFLFARTLANTRRSAQRQVEIQAWQLRQLVPSA